MDPDSFQQAWQAETARTRVTVDADLLRTEVQRGQQEFQSTIFWRDVREVGVSLVMIPIWLMMGMTMSLPWTWYLTVPALLFVSGFILADRRRHPQRPSDAGEPLLYYAKEALAQVEHQIWLLRNIFWWYLLPFCLSLTAYSLQVAWNGFSGWWGFGLFAAYSGLFLVVVYGGIYVLNQYAVRKQLEPRRQDLLKLIAGLEGDACDEDSGDIMELASSLAKPISSCGRSSSWTEDWNRIVPSWRVAAMILVPTLLGAMAGLYSGLKLQIDEMGPTLFQTVVGAVIPFEIALGIVWWRFWKKKQSALADQPSTAPASGIGLDHPSNGRKRLLPRAPAMLILFMITCLTVMAVVALYSFVSHVRGDADVQQSSRGERTLGAWYPKLSPFAGVRWQELRPEVRIGDEWFELVSLDEVLAAEIVAYSQRTNGELWRKRFEEDLVELLSRMGHPPGETVDLRVKPLTLAETKVLQDVPMTAENRRAIKRVNGP
jgi:hypothetical protein